MSAFDERFGRLPLARRVRIAATCVQEIWRERAPTGPFWWLAAARFIAVVVWIALFPRRS